MGLKTSLAVQLSIRFAKWETGRTKETVRDSFGIENLLNVVDSEFDGHFFGESDANLF